MSGKNKLLLRTSLGGRRPGFEAKRSLTPHTARKEGLGSAGALAVHVRGYDGRVDGNEKRNTKREMRNEKRETQNRKQERVKHCKNKANGKRKMQNGKREMQNVNVYTSRPPYTCIQTL